MVRKWSRGIRIQGILRFIYDFGVDVGIVHDYRTTSHFNAFWYLLVNRAMQSDFHLICVYKIGRIPSAFLIL